MDNSGINRTDNSLAVGTDSVRGGSGRSQKLGRTEGLEIFPYLQKFKLKFKITNGKTFLSGFKTKADATHFIEQYG